MLLYYPIYDNVITYIYYCILYYVWICRVIHCGYFFQRITLFSI